MISHWPKKEEEEEEEEEEKKKKKRKKKKKKKKKRRRRGRRRRRRRQKTEDIDLHKTNTSSIAHFGGIVHQLLEFSVICLSFRLQLISQLP
jgi:FtsZ-interacting cell division protein YlmF